MKKQFFLSILFAVLALISMAQTPYISLSEPIDTSSFTTDSITVRLQQFPGNGSNWHVQPQPQKVGTTVWLQRDTSHYADAYQDLSIGVGNLDAASGYRIRLIIYDDAYVNTDTLYYSEVVTTRPSAQHVQIFSVTPLPMLPKSGYKVTSSAVGQPAKVWGLNATTFQAMTDTFTFGFNSNYSDTLFFLFDSANMVHPSVRIYMKGLTDNWMTSFAPSSAFSSPAYTATTMTMGTPVVTKDSVFTNINITSLGNGGNPALNVIITDTLGPVVYQSLQVVTTTGPIGIPKGSLLSNHYYRITATATTPVNMTTVSTKVFKTLNVDPSTVTVSQQLPQDYVSYTTKSFINPKGSGDSSRVVYAELLENNVVVNSTILTLSDTGTITFTQTGQTSGTSKSVKVRVTNGANLVTTSSSVNVSMLAVGTPIMNPTISVKTVDSIYVGFNVTSLGIPLNPTFHVVIKNQFGVIILDSTRLVTATGIIGIGKGGLVSNNTFTITATLANTMMLGDTDVVVITTKNVNPPSVTATHTNTYVDYSITSTPNTNGTGDSSAIKQLNYYEDNVLVGIDSTGGLVFTRTGRTQGQLYHIKVEVINKANLSSFITFNITMQSLQPNQDPYIDDLFADDASTLRVTTIMYGASAGNISTPRLVRKDMMTSMVDTATVATGLTGVGSIPQYVYTDCVGNHSYQITVIDDNLAGRVIGNTLQQTMPAPELSPVISAVLKDAANNTANVLAVTVRGSTEGNVATLTIHASENNVEIAGSPFTTPPFSGDVNVSYVWDQRTPNTRYKITAELTNVTGGGYDIETVFIYTELGTGIVEVVANTPAQDAKVRVYNYLGQEIVHEGESYTATYQNLRSMYAEKTLMFQVLDADGLPTGKTYSIFMQ